MKSENITRNEDGSVSTTANTCCIWKVWKDISKWFQWNDLDVQTFKSLQGGNVDIMSTNLRFVDNFIEIWLSIFFVCFWVETQNWRCHLLTCKLTRPIICPQPFNAQSLKRNAEFLSLWCLNLNDVKNKKLKRLLSASSKIHS